MEATLEWQRRLRELIPNAAERGALKPILQRMRPEEVLSIFDDDDDAVLASLQQIHREATVSRIESLMSTLQSLVRGLASCFSGGPTPEPFPLQLLPPPAVAEPREHVRTWHEWFSQLYGYMRRAVELFREAASSASDAVTSAVRSFMELSSTFFQQVQCTTESVSSYLEPLLHTLERIVTAISAIQTAHYNHAHHD